MPESDNLSSPENQRNTPTEGTKTFLKTKLAEYYIHAGFATGFGTSLALSTYNDQYDNLAVVGIASAYAAWNAWRAGRNHLQNIKNEKSHQ